ncbi:hypothetical protein ACWD4N_28030, partial [Streptomyces sp. NPDC002586]
VQAPDGSWWIYFESDDPQVTRLVGNVQAVRNAFTVSAARGGEHGLPPEVFEFINATLAEIRGDSAEAGEAR